MLLPQTDAWSVWRHADGPAALRLHRALSAGLAVAVGVIGLLFGAVQLPTLRGLLLPVGLTGLAVFIAVASRLACGRIGLASLAAFSAATLAVGASGSPSDGRAILVAGTSLAVCLSFAVAAVPAPRDVVFMALLVSAYLVVQHLVGRDLLLCVDQSVINVGVAFCVRPFLGVVLRSARSSDELVAQTLAAERRLRTLAFEDQGHHQARRILHDEVLAALRAIEHSGADPDRVRGSCERAARAVRTGEQHPS